MRFDDRLLTVLSQPAEDRHDAAVRWRQLVDLVARAGANNDSEAISSALQEIRREAPRVDEQLRAAAARAVAALPLPFGLLEHFAADTLSVAAPILAAATLPNEQWSALHGTANEETRAFIAALHPGVGSELHRARSEQPPLVTQPALETTPTYVPPALHDVVERIEERRRMRAGETEQAVPRRADSDPPHLFRWECGPTGEITWVEGVPRGPLIGRSIAKVHESIGDGIEDQVLRAFAVRAPFRDGALKVASVGPASGEWKISGVPAFEPADGRFAGYRGVALREAHQAPSRTGPIGGVPEILADPASLRELVHEVKTPLNAIIGFAEIIEGQYLGPADRSYRNRAAEIVRQARLLLTAIDDLDFAAKLHSSTSRASERADLATLVDREAAQLHELAARRGAAVDIVGARFDVPARIEPEFADRLLIRLFAALADQAGEGDRFKVSADLAGERARILVSLPSTLRRLSDSDLFGASPESMHGGFLLRLTRGLAHIAGGDLVAMRGALALVFPRA